MKWTHYGINRMAKLKSNWIGGKSIKLGSLSSLSLESKFAPSTLTGSFCRGMTIGVTSSVWPLVIMQRGPVHYGPLGRANKEDGSQHYYSLGCGICRPCLHLQLYIWWLHVRDNTEACKDISRAAWVYICPSVCPYAEGNPGCLVH